MLGLSAQHMNLCPAGCNGNCVVKICSGNAKATQIGAPNEAAQTNRHRPMMVCPNWQHNSFVTSKPGEKERRGMTYIYLDIIMVQGENRTVALPARVVHWRYCSGAEKAQIQDGTLTHIQMESLTGNYQPFNVGLPTGLRQGTVRNHCWGATWTDRKCHETKEGTPQVSEGCSQTQHGIVLQSATGGRRLALTETEQRRYKRPASDPSRSPGLASHVESGQGYPSKRTTPVPRESHTRATCGRHTLNILNLRTHPLEKVERAQKAKARKGKAKERERERARASRKSMPMTPGTGIEPAKIPEMPSTVQYREVHVM